MGFTVKNATLVSVVIDHLSSSELPSLSLPCFLSVSQLTLGIAVVTLWKIYFSGWMVQIVTGWDLKYAWSFRVLMTSVYANFSM